MKKLPKLRQEKNGTYQRIMKNGWVNSYMMRELARFLKKNLLVLYRINSNLDGFLIPV